jgi:ABC-2 type transport system ATP-binding protein
MPLLSVSSLTKRFNETTAVESLNFTLSAGSCVALLGPNGAGKTTILRLLTGLLKPTKGDISFQGQSITTMDLRPYIGYLPQYPHFPEWMTAKEFLILSGELSYLSKEEATSRAEELGEKMGLKDALKKRIGGFSGGMKQRLGIAQALISSPQLLLLDEPVSSLDPIGRREILTLLETLKEEMTIIFSTHILNDAEEICDDIILLNEGEIIESSSIDNLRLKYQTSLIELEFEGASDHYKDKLLALQTVTDCRIERDRLHLSVTDIASARQEILRIALEEDWPIRAFHINRASLEELFMKAVKQ